MKKSLFIILFFASISIHAQNNSNGLISRAGRTGVAGAGFIAIGGVGLLYASYQTDNYSAVRDFSRISYGCFIVGGLLEMIAFSNLSLISNSSDKKVSLRLNQNGVGVRWLFAQK